MASKEKTPSERPGLRRYEFPDPTPIAVPLKFKTRDSLQELIKRGVFAALSAQAQAQGFESEEDADDFGDDWEDSDLPPTAHEARGMIEEGPFRAFIASKEAERQERLRREQRPAPAATLQDPPKGAPKSPPKEELRQD